MQTPDCSVAARFTASCDGLKARRFERNAGEALRALHPVHGLQLSLALAITSRAKDPKDPKDLQDPKAKSLEMILKGEAEAHMAHVPTTGLTRAIHTWRPSLSASPAQSGQTKTHQYVEMKALLNVRNRTAAKPTTEPTVAMGASLASCPHQSELSEEELSEECDPACLHANIPG